MPATYTAYSYTPTVALGWAASSGHTSPGPGLRLSGLAKGGRHTHSARAAGGGGGPGSFRDRFSFFLFPSYLITQIFNAAAGKGKVEMMRDPRARPEQHHGGPASAAAAGD